MTGARVVAALVRQERWRLTALLVLAAACNRAPDALDAHEAAAARPGACPAREKAEVPLPGTPAELEQLAYWLPERDDVLLDATQLAVQDEALRRGIEAPRGITDLRHDPSADELRGVLDERLESYRALLRTKELLGAPHSLATLDRAGAEFVDRRALHVALAPVALRCVPLVEPLHSGKGGDDFDRNRCSQARAQEPIELLGRVGRFRVARTRNAFGFIEDDAALSPALSPERAAAYRRGPDLSLTRTLTLSGQSLPEGTLLQRDEDGAAIAGAEGFTRSRALTPDERTPTRRPLTRKSFLEAAFRYVGTPYGWGDANGGRDCSRFVLDVLASFGLTLPRTSAHQRSSGLYTLEVPEATSETERLALLDAAHDRGVVLVHFPGHIMFYLGRDRAGVPRALHAFAEYLERCPGGGETLREVGRVGVSDLSLGKGTSRRSFLERMTHLTVFGRAPGYELLALSRFRAPVPPSPKVPKVCKDGPDAALFVSPRTPDARRPLRAISVSKTDQRPAGLFLIAPDGTLHAPEQHDLGVGPFARWAEQATPTPGRWRVLLADGEQVLACKTVEVVASAPVGAPRTVARAPAWTDVAPWDGAAEQLYAAFVEQLFSHPERDMRSWASLSELLQKPERNLLFDHRGLDEDVKLTLAPDCADLPYLLRAYFAWKLGLPFGFHRCTRGKAGAPPRCSQLVTQAEPSNAKSDLAAFEGFWRILRDGVHSASGRTLPDDPVSDLYPLPLTRSALTPGSVFIDPYGHMIVVAKWIPQGLLGQGMLMGADAQPDATVGRRRFWRGNFLFTPKTDEVGAGFKGFRPLVRQPGTPGATPLDDAAISARDAFPAPSKQQYQGDLDAFYARMDELIYPRPVALFDRMSRVVDALDEQVKRRVEAIDVGEAGLRGHREPVPMPEGYSIFETSGPWEDFATPSRDMRLLIAIDAVRAFPAAVQKTPERYGIARGEAALGAVDAQLTKLLAERHFTYTRSDGSTFTLTLSDVVSRMATLEVAYNPNDCPERRWGAPEGSPERAPCTRSAPDDQRARLEQYRPWFRDRTRPPRP